MTKRDNLEFRDRIRETKQGEGTDERKVTVAARALAYAEIS